MTLVDVREDLIFSKTLDIPLERGALMITRRTLEGALKCSLRDLRREL